MADVKPQSFDIGEAIWSGQHAYDYAALIVPTRHQNLSEKMSPDLYCKVYVDGNVSHASLITLISTLLDGRVERRSVSGTYFVADVFVNKQAKFIAEPDDFVEWPFYLEIEPDNAQNIDPQLYLNSLASLLSALNAKGLKVVPACGFENELNSLIKAITS